MYQIAKQNDHKKMKVKQQKLHSVRLLDFNSQWSHQMKNQKISEAEKKMKRISQFEKETNQSSRNTKAKLEKLKKNLSNQYDINNLDRDTDPAQIYPKKKAFSQLQSYKKLDFSGLQSRFSKPKEDCNMEAENVSQMINEDQLIVNSVKLQCVKLPQLKISSRENKIIKKVKVQNLREINIHERIKTMKDSLQKDQNNSICSQVATEALKNKAKIIAKLNRKLQHTRNATEISENQSNTYIAENVRKQRNMRKVNVNQQNHQENVPYSISMKNQKKIDHAKGLSHSQSKEKAQQLQNQEQIEEDSSSRFPKLQIYDKKMKIGRKKKSQQDRIRAMLLRTLQKTKGTDYVAQQGSSQKKSPRNSIPNTKRSLSKEPKQQQSEKPNLILLQEQKEQKSLGKKTSLKRVDMQRLKKSLDPSSRFSQNRSSSKYIKNKKFVEIVTERQDRRRKFQQLEEIKEEKTLSKDENESSQRNNKDKRKTQQVSDNEENEFLP